MSKEYTKGQIDLFNRLWDASFGKNQDTLESVTCLAVELNRVREELQKDLASQKRGFTTRK